MAATSNRAPIVTASSKTLTHNQSIAASSLFTATDPNGDPIITYALMDLTGNGYFMVNGVAQASNVEIDLTAAQLAQTIYVAGSGSDQISIRASDGTLWSTWQTATVTAPVVLSPSDFASVDAYVAAVRAQGDPPAPIGIDPSLAAQRTAMYDLVPHSEATSIAVKNGSWFDPTTWADGKVPGAGAKVLIPEAITVNYDGISDASLFTVRIDGKLLFATDHDTRMVVDTMVVGQPGLLQIGTKDNAAQDGVNAEIVIANNGPINVSWDPTLLSRGLISDGSVDIHGQEKTSFLKLATDPMAGDTTLSLQQEAAA